MEIQVKLTSLANIIGDIAVPASLLEHGITELLYAVALYLHHRHLPAPAIVHQPAAYLERLPIILEVVYRQQRVEQGEGVVLDVEKAHLLYVGVLQALLQVQCQHL